MMTTQWTKPNSTPWAVHQEYTLSHVYVILCSISWIRILPTDIFKGSCILVPCSVQYKTLFPIIAELQNHRGPLVDPNTWEPYPMGAVGNFYLKDAFFPGCPGDSLLFHASELAELVGKGYHIPTYQEKAAESTGSSKTHQSPYPKENSQKPPCKDEESSKASSRTSGTSSPWVPDSTNTSKPLHKLKLSPTSKE